MQIRQWHHLVTNCVVMLYIASGNIVSSQLCSLATIIQWDDDIHDLDIECNSEMCSQTSHCIVFTSFNSALLFACLSKWSLHLKRIKARGVWELFFPSVWRRHDVHEWKWKEEDEVRSVTLRCPFCPGPSRRLWPTQSWCTAVEWRQSAPELEYWCWWRSPGKIQHQYSKSFFF